MSIKYVVKKEKNKHTSLPKREEGIPTLMALRIYSAPDSVGARQGSGEKELVGDMYLL